MTEDISEQSAVHIAHSNTVCRQNNINIKIVSNYGWENVPKFSEDDELRPDQKRGEECEAREHRQTRDGLVSG